MSREPDWSSEEFEVLLNNPLLTDAELAPLLPERSTGAIGVVRAGIHALHTGRNHSMLSQMMVQRLMAPSKPILCPLCKQMF